MDQELHKWFADEFASFAVRGEHVEHAVEWEQKSNLHNLPEFLRGLQTPKSGQTFIPKSSQQLLDVGMSNKL